MAARLAIGLIIASVPYAAAMGQGGPQLWTADDRVVIGDFSHITSIAAGPDRVYITSPTSLVIWDPRFRRWEGTVEPPDPSYLRGIFASLVDPLDHSVWFVGQAGWTHYEPNIELWDRGTLPGRIASIAFDDVAPGSGPHFRTSRGWYSVPRGSSIPVPARAPGRPVAPLSVQDVLRENPWLDANRAAILRSPRMGTARYTAAARAFDRQGWYLGTAGAGLLFAPEGAAVPTPLAFGLPSSVVGALFAGPRGLWVGTDRTATAEGALTFVGRELDEFHSLEGSAVFGVRFNSATELVGSGSYLWVASDLGVVRIGTDGHSVSVIDEGNGLPDRRVLAMASRHGRIAVGTRRGLAVIDDSLGVTRIAPAFADAAISVAMAGDTVWTGTRFGVFLALPDSSDLFRPRGAGLGASLSQRVPVLDLTWMADTLVGLTADRLLWRDPGNGAGRGGGGGGAGGWTLGPPLSPQLGRLRRVIADARGLWVAGERGVGFVTLTAPPLRPLVVARDLPAEPYDLAVDHAYLWIATPRGLVRFRLDAVRP